MSQLPAVTSDRIPTIPASQAAVHWAVDELIRSQPGAYVIRTPGKADIWTSPLGALRGAQQVLTNRGSVVTRQVVDLRQPDSSIRRFVVSMSITEFPAAIEPPTLGAEVADEQYSGDADLGASGDLQPGAEVPDSEAAEEDHPQGPQAAVGRRPDSNRKDHQ